jgi:hypothetical protein
MNKDRLLNELLPYRMRAVDTLNVALRFRMKWVEPPPLSIRIDGKLAVEGNLYAFTNPAIEAGLVCLNSRAKFCIVFPCVFQQFVGLRGTEQPVSVELGIAPGRSFDQNARPAFEVFHFQ